MCPYLQGPFPCSPELALSPFYLLLDTMAPKHMAVTLPVVLDKPHEVHLISPTLQMKKQPYK